MMTDGTADSYNHIVIVVYIYIHLFYYFKW